MEHAIRSSNAVATLEAAYNLSTSSEDWLTSVLDTLTPDHPRSMGCFGLRFHFDDRPGVRQRLTFDDLAHAGLDPKVHGVFALATNAQAHYQVPGMQSAFESYSWAMYGSLSHVGGLWSQLPGNAIVDWSHQEFARPAGVEDALMLIARDASGDGVIIGAPVKETVRIPESLKTQLWKISMHILAGNRLRRALRDSAKQRWPLDAEAIIDSNAQRVVHAEGLAKDRSYLDRLLDYARKVDQIRTSSARHDSQAALNTWQGLRDGRWSLVDWFDSDGRRFVVARPNEPGLSETSQLTPTEQRIYDLAVRGDDNQAIAYRLGISDSTVSTHLTAIKRKRNFATRSQLVRSWDRQKPTEPDDDPEG